MDALRFLAAGAALLLCWWIYAHGLANVIEAVAIVLAKHARWLRRAHEGREQKQYGQLTRLLVEDNVAVHVGIDQCGPNDKAFTVTQLRNDRGEIEREFQNWERGHA